MRDLLIVFVKHPIPGQVKTRLAKGIGAEGALAVYNLLLKRTRKLAVEMGVDVWVGYGNEVPASDLWAETAFERFMQTGKDLGARMHNAFARGFEAKYQHIVLIGSDNAMLELDHLAEAFEALDRHNAVLGPAEDGGYYLVGLNQPLPQIFTHKKWSTDTVLAATKADLDRMGVSYHLLATLNDVDTVDDLTGTFLAERFAPRRPGKTR